MNKQKLLINLILSASLVFNGCGEKSKEEQKQEDYQSLKLYGDRIKELSIEYEKTAKQLEIEKEKQGSIHIFNNDIVNSLEEKEEVIKAERVEYYKMLIEDLNKKIDSIKEKNGCWTVKYCDNSLLTKLDEKLSILENEQIKYDTFWEKNGDTVIEVVSIAAIIAANVAGGDGQSAGNAVKNIASAARGAAVIAAAAKAAKVAKALKATKSASKIAKLTKQGKNLAKVTGAKFMKANFSDIVKKAPNQIGVYVVRKDGKVMYVGRAIEQRVGQATSGLRKRLLEHFRGSRSGKKELFQNRDKVNVEIIPLKSVEAVKKMEAELIRKYDTVTHGWNKRNEMVKVVK